MPSNNFKLGELLDRRSPNSKTFINFDGSYTTEIYKNPIHFEDYEGNLHNINTDLYDEADLDVYEGPLELNGQETLLEAQERARADKETNTLNRENYDFQGVNVPFLSKIPRNFQRGYCIGHGGETLHFTPVNASPSMGIVDHKIKNKIHYQDVWNDSDVCLELKETGLKETIVLKTDKSPLTFSFEVNGTLEDDLTAGTMKLEPAWLEDAEGTKRDVLQTIRQDGEQTFIDLVADTTDLVYPIYIDPTVTIQPDGATGIDTYVTSGNAGFNFANDNYLVIGSSSTEVARTLIKFDLSSIPIGSFVSSATLSLFYSGYYYSGATTIGAYRITSNWVENTVTWNNQPSFDITLQGSLSQNYSIDLNNFYSITITNLINSFVSGQYTNYGILLKKIDESTLAMGGYESSDYGTVSERPKLSVTYNVPPTTPTVTAPNGGETFNSSHTISWTPSTDTETAQASLRYHIQLSTNNGSTWKDIVALTSAGATSYTYDFINEAETSVALIRIRAYDGTSYGAYDQSNGVFSIVHNQAPSTPTNLSPIGTTINRALINRISWQHVDANNNDPQSKFDLNWRLQGAGTWNTVTQITPNNFYDAPSNLFPSGTIEYQVRTYDQAGLSGPYSAINTFLSSDKPTTPSITSPADGSTVAIANPVIQWSAPSQTDYHVKVMDSTGTNLIWEQKATSTNKAVTVGINLTNLTSYKVQVAIKSTPGGLYSDFDSHNINVSFTAPAKPIVSVSKDDVRGSISLDVTNLTPAGTVPTVSTMDVFRKNENGEFVRIEKDFVANTSYSETKQSLMDFNGKIANDTITNPHIAKRTAGGSTLSSAVLLSPSANWPVEFDQNWYNGLYTQNGTADNLSNSANTNISQQLFSFDLIKEIEKDFGTIPGTSTADKVAWLTAYVTNIRANWYGNGSAVNGYKAYMVSWDANQWWTINSHTNSAISLITASLTSTFIQSDGFVHHLAYADPSGPVANPTTAPTLSVSANAGSTLTAGTYYIRYSYANTNGETLLSPESSITVASGQNLNVTLPSFPFNVNGAFVYFNTSTGQSSAFKVGTSGLTTYTRSTPIGSSVTINSTNTALVPSGINTDYISNTVTINYTGLKGTFTDYAVKPNTTQEYFVRAYGSNGTYSDSDVVSATAGISLTQLSLVSDPTQYVTLALGTALGVNKKVERSLMQFAGRKFAVAEFGEKKENAFNYTYIIKTAYELEILESLLDSQETLLLRDTKGRKVYVTLDSVDINELSTHWEITLNPSQVDYSEEV